MEAVCVNLQTYASCKPTSLRKPLISLRNLFILITNVTRAAIKIYLNFKYWYSFKGLPVPVMQCDIVVLSVANYVILRKGIN
jgi:hypothetical protein